jgi:hypothetical protein
MAEIKSTLELALERTKKVTISEKEKDEIKRKEILQKVHGLFHRYQEGYLPLSEILREIERMDQKTKTLAKESLLSQWIDALSLDEEDERLIRGIEALKGQEMSDWSVKLNHLLSQYRKEKEEVKQGIRGQSEEALRREGIYGSAVEPNIENDQIWKENLENLNQIYNRKLKDLKDQLRIS